MLRQGVRRRVRSGSGICRKVGVARTCCAGIAALLGACSTTPPPPDSISYAIGSPCGFFGGLETIGAGIGIGALGGAVYGTKYSLACTPAAYPFCLAAATATGATVGLGVGIYETIAYTPACGDEMDGMADLEPSVEPFGLPLLDDLAYARAEPEPATVDTTTSDPGPDIVVTTAATPYQTTAPTTIFGIDVTYVDDANCHGRRQRNGCRI